MSNASPTRTRDSDDGLTRGLDPRGLEETTAPFNSPLDCIQRGASMPTATRQWETLSVQPNLSPHPAPLIWSG